jgi:predicted nucleic-acid-binding protein
METLLKVYSIEDIDLEEIWEKSLFFFDTNVLLDLYRLPRGVQEDLLKIFKHKNFNNKIFISFQVMLEFLNNTHNVVGDQKNSFFNVHKALDTFLSDYNKIYKELEENLTKLKLKNRHSLIDIEKFINQKKKNKSLKFINEFKKDLDEKYDEAKDIHEEDILKKEILELFNGKVTTPFTKDEIDQINEDGKERYKNKIPPGYEDEKKGESFYIYKNIKYYRKFGDLILWKDIIKKVKTDNLEYVVLITGDVKDDWWFRPKGKKIGARRELLNEIYFECPNLKYFHLYNTTSFIENAKQYLDSSISNDSINAVKQNIDKKYDLYSLALESANALKTYEDIIKGTNLSSLGLAEMAYQNNLSRYEELKREAELATLGLAGMAYQNDLSRYEELERQAKLATLGLTEINLLNSFKKNSKYLYNKNKGDIENNADDNSEES